MRFAGGNGTDLVMLSDAWPVDPFERFAVSIKIETVKKTFCKIQTDGLERVLGAPVTVDTQFAAN